VLAIVELLHRAGDLAPVCPNMATRHSPYEGMQGVFWVLTGDILFEYNFTSAIELPPCVCTKIEHILPRLSQLFVFKV
jgi:hypothetical protein